MLKKSFLLLVLLAHVATFMIAQDGQDRNVSSFDKLQVSGPYIVHLSQGATEKVVVKAPSGKAEQILTEVKDGQLKIYEKSKGYSNRNSYKESPVIYVTFKNLEKIGVSGASNLKGDGMMKFDDLGIHASGASTMKIDFQAKDLNCHVSGASNIKLSGSADEMEVHCSGASKVRAEDLSTNSAAIEASGASSISLHTDKSIQVKASGASSVRYSGNPTDVDKNETGASSIRKM